MYGIQFHLDKAHDRVDALEAELASYKGGEATALRLLEKAEARVRELERWKATAFPILARIDEKARETEGD